MAPRRTSVLWPTADIVGNGHMLMLEQNSDEIAAIILDWLAAANADR